jgi:Cu2+-exporting ATPase
MASSGAAERAADAHTGHGGHAGMSMAEMAKDMRRRFLVAIVFAIPIFLYSPIAVDVFGLELAGPFGMRTDVLSLLLSLPVVFYSSTIFFRGAISALRNRTLDMMVLVATSISAGFVYSVAVVLGLEGEHFFEAIALLAAFVLFGHWMEMRARGGVGRRARAARPRAADGPRAPRRRADRGADRRGAGRRPPARASGIEGSGGRRRRGGDLERR